LANLRDQVAAELGGPVEDWVWDLLEDKGYVEDLGLGLMPTRELAATARRLMAALPGDTRPAPVREPGLPQASEAARARIRALSAIYAEWASARTDLRRYRSGVLARTLPVMAEATGMTAPPADESGLLLPEHAGPWVRWCFDAGSPGGDGRRHVFELVAATKVHGPRKVADLWYIDGDQEKILTVPAGGMLGQLAGLADALVDDYRWRPSEATTFVLTGQAPEVSVYVGSAEIRYGEMSAASRVTMTLDPALSPEDVAGIYARLRQRFHAGPLPRHQPARRYRLAAHVGPHLRVRSAGPASRRGPGRPLRPGPHGLIVFIEPTARHSWKSLRQSWNSACDALPASDPGRAWRYGNDPNFIRDAKAAYQQLLFPGWTSHP
jgi:hypothetical protein